MDNQFKVCGNCGHVTMADGKFVCMDPVKREPEVVKAGERRECFVVAVVAPPPSHMVH